MFDYINFILRYSYALESKFPVATGEDALSQRIPYRLGGRAGRLDHGNCRHGCSHEDMGYSIHLQVIHLIVFGL